LVRNTATQYTSGSGALGPGKQALLIIAIILSVEASSDLSARTTADIRQSLSGFASETYLGERERLSLGVRGGLAVCDSEPGFDIAILPSIYNESYVFCDIGVGWELIQDRSWISAFLILGVSLLEEGTSPVVTGEFGYSLGSRAGGSAADLRGFMVGLGMGLRIPAESNLNVWINLGYRLQQSRDRYEAYDQFGNARSSLEDVRYDIFRATLGVSIK
jgi:hypothetical protein